MKYCLFWTIGFLRSGYVGSEGHLGTIWGHGLEVDLRVNLRVILEVILDPF